MRAGPALDRSRRRGLVAAVLVSLAAWTAAERVAPPRELEWTPAMQSAAVRMQAALTAVRAHHEAAGDVLDGATDPNRTGLVGPAYSELFTTLGRLEAKRTTTNPDVAALLVHLLERAGVTEGDRVAVGASGSFPALLVATSIAVEALGAHPVTILSLGASSYGATRPDFDLASLHRLLLETGAIGTPAAAVSLGGAGDVGADFEPTTRARLLAGIRASGIPLVHEPDLRHNVARRLEVYDGPGPPAAFVNIGGADANVGSSPTVLGLRPGLVRDVALPPPGQRGVLHAMAARGVPVIHLLDVRSLAVRHGLPWDPLPLPAPGTTRLTRDGPARDLPIALIAAAWLGAIIVIFVTANVKIPGSSAVPDPPGETHHDVP
jgi:poly-gamma-glutamate system protein